MDTATKYKLIREAAAKIVVNEFIKIKPELNGHLRITDIDGTALKFLKNNWKNHPIRSRNVGSAEDWRNTLKSYRTSYSNRIEAAIWYDSHLCALLLGKCSKKKFIARITYLQGNYDDDYLKGLRVHIATRYLEVFAAANQIEWVGIQSPYEGATPLYHERGFNLSDPNDRKNDALCKKIKLPKVP